MAGATGSLSVNLGTSNPNGYRHVYGGDGNDTITGNANDNWIIGGTGGDTLNGGNGNDFLLFDEQDAPINGGEGFDLAQTAGWNDDLPTHKNGSSTLRETGCQ